MRSIHSLNDECRKKHFAMSLNDADCSADSRIVTRARRLGLYLLLTSATWLVFIVLNLVETTPRIVQGERVANRNLLRMGPQVIQLITPCHIPLFGEYPDPLYLAVCYGFSCGQILIAILIARRALELRNLRNHRGCKRAAILAAIPFMGLWIGIPCWILSTYLLAFLWKPEVKKAFEQSASPADDVK